MSGGGAVVFIHGLWVSRDAWSPWREVFEEAGYVTYAPGYPGEADTIAETRSFPERQARTSADDIVDHYGNFVRGLAQAPVVIGHSFGALIAQKLLDLGLTGAAIVIDPPTIGARAGLPHAEVRAAFSSLADERAAYTAHRLTDDQFRYVYGYGLSRAESHELWERWGIPSTGRPLFEPLVRRHGAAATASASGQPNAPMLLLTGTVEGARPDAGTRHDYLKCEPSGDVVEEIVFEGRGHSLAIDTGWKDVADASLRWLHGRTGQEAGTARWEEVSVSGDRAARRTT